jgi:hypothetical protein
MTRAAKAGQNLLYRHDQPRKDPFHVYSMSPHLTQFPQSAEATPLWLDSVDRGWLMKDALQ